MERQAISDKDDKLRRSVWKLNMKQQGSPGRYPENIVNETNYAHFPPQPHPSYKHIRSTTYIPTN